MKRDVRLIIRFSICIILFVSLLIAMLWRAVNLTIWDPYHLKHKQSTLTHKQVVHKAPRGEFFDRHHYPLAMNVPRYRVYLDLGRFSLSQQQKQDLSSMMSMDVDVMNRMMSKHKNKYFLLSQIDHGTRMSLLDSGIPGLHFEELLTRYYPLGASSAQLLGRMDREGMGVEGIEKLYQSHLNGQDGLQRVRHDRKGHAVGFSDHMKTMQIGQSLVLTIDHRIQQYVYRELLSQIEASEAKSGAVVVLNSKGDIIAMVSAPSYDPNNRIDKVDARMANKSVVDVFEPGSTIKPIAFAALLPHLRKDKIVDTEHGRYRLDKYMIKDVRDYGSLTLTEVMSKSSNVAMIKLTKQVGGDALLKTYQAYKLFEPSYAGLMGEHVTLHGAMMKPGSVGYYSMSYGYGMQVSLLQLAHAYLILANRGVDPGIHLMSEDRRPRSEPQRVSNASIIDQLTKMMVVSVEKGTGKNAKMSGIDVAGKTGTTQISVAGRYTEKKHVATFAGFAPANADVDTQMRYTVAVVIFEPKVGKHYGGLAAAPLFAKIMNYTLSLNHDSEGNTHK